MQDDRLVQMANQIAAYFHAYPRDQALPGIREHIVAFWTPKMRASLDLSAPELDPLAREALQP
jgi:formate dehydrogenase subunit delta